MKKYPKITAFLVSTFIIVLMAPIYTALAGNGGDGSWWHGSGEDNMDSNGDWKESGGWQINNVANANAVNNNRINISSSNSAIQSMNQRIDWRNGGSKFDNKGWWNGEDSGWWNTGGNPWDDSSWNSGDSWSDSGNWQGGNDWQNNDFHSMMKDRIKGRANSMMQRFGGNWGGFGGGNVLINY